MIKSRCKSGQSVVIGALLLLALFVAFISWFQITQVPVLNQNAEAENNDIIRSDMFEFQDKSYDSILTDSVNQVSFNTKVSYRFELAGLQNNIGQFSIDEFDDEPINITRSNQSVDGLPSRMISLTYTPSYNERTENDYIYENGILVENQTTRGLDRGGQRFVRGDNIYLFEFEADFVSLQSPNTIFTIVPERDLQTTNVTGAFEDINNDGTETQQDIDIELDTNLDAETWERLLNNQANVVDVSDNVNSVIITLDGSEEYTVHTGKSRIET